MFTDFTWGPSLAQENILLSNFLINGAATVDLMVSRIGTIGLIDTIKSIEAVTVQGPKKLKSTPYSPAGTVPWNGSSYEKVLNSPINEFVTLL